MRFPMSVDLAAFLPRFLQHRSLALIFHSPAAQRGLQPRIAPARLNPQAAAHRPHREETAMLGNERRRHWARTNAPQWLHSL